MISHAARFAAVVEAGTEVVPGKLASGSVAQGPGSREALEGLLEEARRGVKRPGDTRRACAR